MLAVTHLVVSLLLIQLLTLDKNDAFVALTFGVMIDFDHLFGLKDYIDANGVAAIFDFDSLMNADGQWKSMLHSPAAVMVVGPVATASRLALPLVFWGTHVTMDCVEESFLGLFSAWEMLLLASSSAALLYIALRRRQPLGHPERSFDVFTAGLLRALSPVTRLTRTAFGRQSR